MVYVSLFQCHLWIYSRRPLSQSLDFRSHGDHLSAAQTISSPEHIIRTAVSSIMSPGKKGPDQHTNVFSNLTARVFLNRCTRDELNYAIGIQRYWVRSCRAYVKYIICQANRNVALRIIMVFMCLRLQHFTGFESLYGCNSTSFHVNWKYIQ